jgi:hypothetical protein
MNVLVEVICFNIIRENLYLYLFISSRNPVADIEHVTNSK